MVEELIIHWAVPKSFKDFRVRKNSDNFLTNLVKFRLEKCPSLFIAKCYTWTFFGYKVVLGRARKTSPFSVTALGTSQKNLSVVNFMKLRHVPEKCPSLFIAKCYTWTFFGYKVVLGRARKTSPFSVTALGTSQKNLSVVNFMKLRHVPMVNRGGSAEKDHAVLPTIMRRFSLRRPWLGDKKTNSSLLLRLDLCLFVCILIYLFVWFVLK